MLILRMNGTDEGTPGWAMVNGILLRSLELPWRDNKRNLSRIPAGEYEIQYVKTSRPYSGRYWSYWLKDVPGRSGVLIHSGNWAGDTLKGLKAHSWGCILLGLKMGVLGDQKALVSSRPAINKFHEAMEHGKPGKLTIIGGSDA